MNAVGAGWIATGGGEPGPEVPWLAAVEVDGRIVGTGVVVGPAQVLTGAGVLPGPVGRAGGCRPQVRFPGRSGAPAVSAAGVGPGGLVLLRLDRPVAPARAPLCRLAPGPGRRVEVLGWAAGADRPAALAGAVGPAAADRVEVPLVMDRPAPEPGAHLEGAGVVDTVTGAVIGVVVSASARHTAAGEREPAGPWMVPVDALAGWDPLAVASRIGELAGRVAALTAAEGRSAVRGREVRVRISAVPDLPARALSLRLRLATLRDAERRGEPALDRLDRLHAALDRAEAGVRAHDLALDRLLARRAELRGRLEASRARADAAGLGEDLVLDRLFRQARDALWRAPCDLAFAGQLVEHYERTVSGRAPI